MTFEEVQRYIDYGRVCIDTTNSPQYPGFSRRIIFYSKNRVCIEYIGNWVDSDSEKGYEFCYTFSTLEDAIASIEDYLNKPLDNWVNYTKVGFPLQTQNSADLEQGDKRLRRDIVQNKISLPQKGSFKPNFDIQLLVTDNDNY